MITLKIKVTKDVLERSKMCGYVPGMASQNCAIALAVRDVFPDAFVGADCILANRYMIRLPFEALMFIGRFDTSKPEERPHLPKLEFEIEIPDEVLAQINIDEIRPLLVNHPTLELIDNA